MALYPLGAVTVVFTPLKIVDGKVTSELDASNSVNIALTKKDTDTVLNTTQKMYNIEMDQVPGPYLQNIISGENTFTCTTLLDMDQVSGLSNVYKKGTTGFLYGTAGTPVKYGQLVIHPISMGVDKSMDITCHKTTCQINGNLSFKEEGTTDAELVFTLMANTMVDNSDPKYGKLFEIGAFTEETP